MESKTKIIIVLTRRIASGGLSLFGRWCSIASTTQFAMIVKRTVYSNGVHERKGETIVQVKGDPAITIGSDHECQTVLSLTP